MGGVVMLLLNYHHCTIVDATFHAQLLDLAR